MFAKLFAVTSLALLAAATPAPLPGGESSGGSSCSNGPVQCCNSVQYAGSEEASGILALLGVAVQDLNVPVGLNCSPLLGDSDGQSTCSSNTVCCEDNSNGGLISIGCIPITL
ncbi:fungal hydrophobin-domain-containing protein [Trametes punicea]|nr:fungal hydrophobin-domain-containing protein [Trametes punicea]